MKIAFFGKKEYDEKYFVNTTHDIKFFEHRLSEKTSVMANGYDAVCIFVNDNANSSVIKKLAEYGVKYILLRCAGFNNIDLALAKECNIKVAYVPSYSPEAVAEHAIALAMAANRRIHRAYGKVRNNDYSIEGLKGKNFFQKTVGIVGGGKIGTAMIKICKGFGMNIIVYDVYPNEYLAKTVGFKYVTFNELLEKSDLISLHCPLTDNNKHLINKETIAKMKNGVILVNTARGGLINTEDLIDGIKSNKFHAVALDVYEGESELVFEDFSNKIIGNSITSRLLSFPNVIITSHQAFFTEEALKAIAQITLNNATLLEENKKCDNLI